MGKQTRIKWYTDVMSGEDYTIDRLARVERVQLGAFVRFHAIVRGKRIAIELNRYKARAAIERILSERG